MDDDPSNPSSESPEKAPAPKKRAQLTWSIRLARLWQELKDRDVVRVAIGYTVVGWVIMQVGDIILPNLGFPQWMLSGLIILIILGFPVSMVLAWIYELTPEGIRNTDTVREERRDEVSEDENVGQPGWLLLLIAAGVPALVFGLLAGVFFIRAKTASDELIFITQTMAAREKSIAVLPFENLSLSEEDAFLADGLHNEITSVLSRVKEIKTIARNSTLRYRESLQSSIEIGEELSVANLLTGAVQRMGNHIRINVELIDAYNDTQIWADSFTREYSTESLFEIQSEICTTIGLQLSTVLTPEENNTLAKVPTQNVKALEAYFKGREIVELQIQSQREEAIGFFNEATSLDPEFTLAFVGLGMAHLIETSHTVRAEELYKQQLALAGEAASRALELDDSLSEVHTLLGDVARGKNQSKVATAAYERALEINPNGAEAHYGLARLIERRADYDDLDAQQAAREQLSKAVDLDPNNHLFRRELGRMLRMQGYFEEAQKEMQMSIELRPDYERAYRELGEYVANSLCRYDEAIVLFRKATSLDPTRFTNHLRLFFLFQQLDDQQESVRWGKVALQTGQVAYQPGISAAIDLLNTEDGNQWVEIAEKAVRSDSSWSVRRQLLSADMRAGRVDIALARYLALFPFLSEVEIPTFENNREGAIKAQVAIEFAEILIKQDEKSRANELMDQAWQLYKPLPRMGWHSNWNFGSGYGILDATIHALRGDKRLAMDALKEAIDAGFRDRLQLESSALDTVREEPEFIAMMERVEEDLTEQLENVRRMQANGELAAIPESVLELLR